MCAKCLRADSEAGVPCPLRARKSVPDSYAEQLISEGLMTPAERDDLRSKHYAMLNEKLSNVSLYSPPPSNLQGRWGDLAQPQARVSSWDTGLPVSLLQFVGAKSVEVPEHIRLHSHLGRTHVQVRPAPLLFLCQQPLPWQQPYLFGGLRLDCRSWKKEAKWTGPRRKPWPSAPSSLKVGRSLVLDYVQDSEMLLWCFTCDPLTGFNIRLSGQDVGRGTFSQRHAMVVCQDTSDTYVPLNHISPQQTAFLEVTLNTAAPPWVEASLLSRPELLHLLCRCATARCLRRPCWALSTG